MGFDIGSLGMSLGESVFNGIASLFGQKVANDQARENFDYQWDKAYSPQAQVRNLAAAGINPAVAFGNNSPVFTGSGQFSIPENPLGGVFSHSLSDIANLYNAKANAKKAGAETKNLDIDTQAKEFELNLSKFFSAPEKVAAITLAWKNVMLKNDEHNINEWKQETEKALSQLKGIERDSAQKLFENMDTVIEQENKQRSENIKLTQEKQKTEGTQQTANRAAARASNTQADVNEQEQRLRRALADIEVSGSSFKLEALLRSYERDNAISAADKKEAQVKLARLKDLESKRDSSLFGEVDSFLEWLKNKVTIFH